MMNTLQDAETIHNVSFVCTLQNGVKVYDLSKIVEEDFTEAQEIIDMSSVLSVHGLKVENVYNVRKGNFNAAYEVKICRENDYMRFIEILQKDENACPDMYYPTLEEWKQNKKTVLKFDKSGNIHSKREMRLGKYLQKMNVRQDIIDFYSAQIKDDKEMYLIVSDYAQHIAGMSAYAKMRSWDGLGGTSCLDPRHNHENNIHLLGSLHDDGLYVAFLVDSLEDVQQLQDKMVARTLCRYVKIDGIEYLISTEYYGNVRTTDMLERAIEQVNEDHLYTWEQMYGIPHAFGFNENDKTEVIKECANGFYTGKYTYDYEINQEYTDIKPVQCPACHGKGKLKINAFNPNSYQLEKYNISCSACENGTIEEYVTVIINDTVTLQAELFKDAPISPYNEGYEHFGEYVEIRINLDLLERDKKKYNR